METATCTLAFPAAFPPALAHAPATCCGHDRWAWDALVGRAWHLGACCVRADALPMSEVLDTDDPELLSACGWAEWPLFVDFRGCEEEEEETVECECGDVLPVDWWQYHDCYARRGEAAEARRLG